MKELNKIRFFLFVSLLIFPTSALDVILSGAHQDFKQKSVIDIDIVDGEKIYRGTLNQLTYEAELGISKVIVYIISRSRCIEILRPAGLARDTRSQIAQELREMRCELVFLGIENFDDDEYHLIGALILEKIQFHPEQRDYATETIGEDRFDQFYQCHVMNFPKYQENAQIYGGTLLARLRSIPNGALRPTGTINKEIRLMGYQPYVREVWWPVSDIGDKYFPDVDLSDPQYDFVIKHPDKTICLLIISGKEYSAITNRTIRSTQRKAMREFIDGMIRNKEVLVIMGAFNFDWTEIDIVAQIILRHSKGLDGSVCNVFTHGYGIFDTYYVYEYEGDSRLIHQQPHSYVSEAIKVLMGDGVKKRAIHVYYHYDGEWKPLNIPINLINGRYFPESRLINFTLSSLYQKIAFIVYDRTEMNVKIDYSIVCQSMEELKRSGISVVLIEAVNFELTDIHIIAEWIDYHCGIINLEQVAVLGGGLFDTIFQSESTTYNTFLNTKKNELETIRNAYVQSGDTKSVYVANFDWNSEFEVWSYSMNTLVNGLYERDLVPDRHIFNSFGGRKILFIITSAYNFQQIAGMKTLNSSISSFRRNINKSYPISKWSVFLVGLDNFGERDSHLFAELVERQTNDERSLGEFVRTFCYGISQVIYQYKDTASFEFDTPCTPIQAHFASSFGWICRL